MYFVKSIRQCESNCTWFLTILPIKSSKIHQFYTVDRFCFHTHEVGTFIAIHQIETKSKGEIMITLSKQYSTNHFQVILFKGISSNTPYHNSAYKTHVK